MKITAPLSIFSQHDWKNEILGAIFSFQGRRYTFNGVGYKFNPRVFIAVIVDQMNCGDWLNCIL